MYAFKKKKAFCKKSCTSSGVSCVCLTFLAAEVLWFIKTTLFNSLTCTDNTCFALNCAPPPELGGLLKYVRPFLNSISKAKAARLVRSLLDLFLDMEAATGQEVELCLECIEWAKAEKRTFLRQALEVRQSCSQQMVCSVSGALNAFFFFFCSFWASENSLLILKWHLIKAPTWMQCWVFLPSLSDRQATTKVG